MAQAYSGDLRIRVIKAAAGGMSARQAAARFGVGVTTAFVWIRRFRANGEARARRQDKPKRLTRTSRWPRSPSGSRQSVACASGSPASGTSLTGTAPRTKKTAHAAAQQREDVR